MHRISAALAATLTGLFLSQAPAAAEPVTLLALGDSLTAGYGLDPAAAYPVKLEQALKARGHDVVVINAGVSGDTAAQGAARLEWSLTDDVDGVIVELGANDALRGLDPAQAEAALKGILDALASRKLPVLIAGMRAPPNLGPDYAAAFEGMYARLAAQSGALIYPFFLEGVAADPKLNQADGLHPTPEGVDAIVARILPSVEALLALAKK
jgi:acyl-CoA thioesterase-1